MLDVLPIAIPGFVFLNAWTALRFWQDKMRAQAGERRITESSLLGLALIGGSPGALLARRYFRHKTRKEPFSTYLRVIVIIQISATMAFVIFRSA